MRRFAIALLLLAASCGGQETKPAPRSPETKSRPQDPPPESAAPATGEAITFNKHVAPILWKNCASCHSSGRVAPFPLVTYKDARKRATFIRDVTVARRMPPWRAEPGFGPFKNERRLSDADVKTLSAWVDAGAPEGSASDLPPLPTFREGWQLGEPDLVLKMPAPYTMLADGADIFRCFVIPIPTDEEKMVAAVEFHPGNVRIIHHAGFTLDDKGAARKRDREDGKPGYTSFEGPGVPTIASLGGWSLASLPRWLPEGTAIPLPKGCDLVMQIHYHPSGKEETDCSELGVYFAKKPPTRFVAGVDARTRNIDIPAGEKRHCVTAESQPLPVEVSALTVTPHMHFLGKEISASAVLPDGKTLPLVGIKDWDFNWHERYEFRDMPRLPKGTVIKVEGVYDNSTDNPRNPNNPPKPVKYGTNLMSNEMLSCQLEVVTESRDDLKAIQALKKTKGPGEKPPVEGKD